MSDFLVFENEVSHGRHAEVVLLDVRREICTPPTPQACSSTRSSSSMLSPNASTASTSGTIRMGVATPHKGVRVALTRARGCILSGCGGFTYIHASTSFIY